MANSSRSPLTTILVPVLPSSSSWVRAWVAITPRSPESMRTAPSSRPATSTALPDAAGDVVGVDQQGGAGAERLDLGREGRPLVVVQQRERVRRGTGGGDPVPAGRLEVGGRGEAGQVGRPGGRHRRLLVRPPRPHLDDRPAGGRRDHAGRGRGDRAVVVEDRQGQGLQHDRLAEGAGHRQDGRVREVQLALPVAVDVAGEPEVGEIVRRRLVDGAELAQHADRVGVEPEPLQGVEQPAGAGRPRRIAGPRAAAGRTARTRTGARRSRRAGPSRASSARSGR